jgi:predicted HAD superfamily Cof-like phosphohydrolase
LASEEQRLVEEFHRATNSTVGDTPGIRDAVLRISLMEEELSEVIEAIESGNMESVAKEIADLLYVVHGTSVAFGLDMEPIFKEVHVSNMTKVGGKKRLDGKQLKDENYKKPDIGQYIRTQRGTP